MLATRATQQAKAGLALGLTMVCVGASFAMAQPASTADHLPRDVQAHYKKVWGDEFDGDKLDLSVHDGAESWEKVKNLEGIQHAKNLTFVSLKNTEVRDLTPLNSLKKLKSVELSWPLTINR